MAGHDGPIPGTIVTAFIDPLIAFVSAHAWLAYLAIFLAALLEAVPIVGSVIPGSTIILALSALIPGGELDLLGVLAAAIAGKFGREAEDQVVEVTEDLLTIASLGGGPVLVMGLISSFARRQRAGDPMAPKRPPANR